MKRSRFKKGMTVYKHIRCAQMAGQPGHTLYAVETVLKTDKSGVWLDNGQGNDPSGPFDAVSGMEKESWVPGFSSWISEQIEAGALPDGE